MKTWVLWVYLLKPLPIDRRSWNGYDEPMDFGKRILSPLVTTTLVAVPVVFSIIDPLHLPSGFRPVSK